MIFILSALGKFFAILPERLVDALCRSIGWLICRFPCRRSRVGHMNVARCFPDMPKSERSRIVYESCRRMVEMALFVVSSPHISESRLKKRIKISPYVLSELRKFSENPRPTVLMIPHFAMMETITMFPLLADCAGVEVGVFYRPFGSKSLEKWVKNSRKRFGVELLSRRNGLHAAVDILRRNGIVAVLYDQNPREYGVLSFFFDRLCTTTDLPGILVEYQKADCAVFYAKRTGFWSSYIDGNKLEANTIEGVTEAGNLWLENKLKEDETARFDWLWLHHRWHFDREKFFSLNVRKDATAAWLSAHGLTAMPRKTEIVFNMPESPSESLSLLPCIAALRRSRPDSLATIVVPAEYAETFRTLGVADNVVAAQRSVFARLCKFGEMRDRYAEFFINCRDSFSADLESRRISCRKSFAVQSTRRRRFTDCVYKPDSAAAAEPLSLEFESFLRRFEMRGDVDYSPLTVPTFDARPGFPEPVIAVIVDKTSFEDWGLANWTGFIKEIDSNLESVHFRIFAEDAKDVFEISKSVPDADIESLSSKISSDTDFIREALSCEIVVGLDSFRLRLANTVGVKSAVLCGTESNLIRNGMVFDAPKCEIQAHGAPRQGGTGVAGISVREVAEAVMNLLSR